MHKRIMHKSILLAWLLCVWSAPLSAADPASCDGPISDWIEGLYGANKDVAYRCLIEREEAGLALMARLDKEEKGSQRAPAMSRALALFLLERSDRLFQRNEIKALLVVDRRCLRAGLRARKGRKSPAPNHDKVFSKFDWYQTDPGYTDKRLTEIDRENSLHLDKLPPLSAVTPTVDTPPPPPAVVEDPSSSGRFGCAVVSSNRLSSLSWLLFATMWLGFRRSRTIHR